MFMNHPLVATLTNLRGNVRGCVYTEPLWGIPYNLYAPYISIYMLAFGLTDSQIGRIVTLGLICQFFWTTISGSITDKLGRKRTTLIFDILSWSVPCLIWAAAHNYTYFVIAVIINSAWRVPQNSWQCLLVEDTDPRLLVDVYSWIYIAGLLAAFVSPLTGLLIGKFTLVPTMRGLYLLAFVMMTAKFFILNKVAVETRQGLVRLHATKDQHLFVVFRESLSVLKQILHTPATLITVGLMSILSICWMIRDTFWAILVTEKLQIPAAHLAIYPFIRSIVMLLFFFTVMPKLRNMEVRKPLLVGFTGLMLSQIALLVAPVHGYLVLVLATVLEACCIPLTTTFIDKLTVITVDAKERARIMAILYVTVIVCTAPFGWIAGDLSEINRSLPFLLNIILFSLGGLLTYLAR